MQKIARGPSETLISNTYVLDIKLLLGPCALFFVLALEAAPLLAGLVGQAGLLGQKFDLLAQLQPALFQRV